MSSSLIKAATFRHPRNLAAARLSEWASPALKVAASLFSRTRPTPPSSWRRGIVVGAGHIGDVLYNTASLPALAEALPDCEWHYLASPPASEILTNNPSVKSCVPSLESPGPVDVAICYNSGGYWRDLIAATRRGIPNRVGYVHKGFSALVTHPIQINYPQPFPAYFRELVGQLTALPSTWPLRPRVYPSSEDEERAQSLWQELEFDPTRPVLACFVTSRQARGVWRPARFAAAIREVEKEPDIQTVLLGAPGDQPVLEELKAGFHLKARIAAGKLRLLALVCFLQKCTAVLSTDSGPRHLANAAGVRVAYVRNISFSKVEAGRYCETEFDLAPDIEFVSREEQDRVFSVLDPVQVAKDVLKVLRDSRASSSGPAES